MVSCLYPILGKSPPRRQDLEDLYVPCGAIYIYSREFLEEPEDCEVSWIELQWPEWFDVDEPEDLEIAQCIASTVSIKMHT